VVFSVMTPYSLVGGYESYCLTYCFTLYGRTLSLLVTSVSEEPTFRSHLEGSYRFGGRAVSYFRVEVCPENGGIMFVCNIGNYFAAGYTAS
jgi:hypothetical protein